MPEEVRRIEIGPKVVPSQAAQLEQSFRIVDREAGMGLERNPDSFLGSLRGLALPVGNKDLIPLVFQDAGVVEWPGTGDPIRRPVPGSAARATAEAR